MAQVSSTSGCHLVNETPLNRFSANQMACKSQEPFLIKQDMPCIWITSVLSSVPHLKWWFRPLKSSLVKYCNLARCEGCSNFAVVMPQKILPFKWHTGTFLGSSLVSLRWVMCHWVYSLRKYHLVVICSSATQLFNQGGIGNRGKR